MRVLLFFLIALLASCASKKKIAEFEAQPDWIQKKPVDAGHYIGVGSAKKVGTSFQYTREAKEDALADLASEISIQISSTSVLRTIESDFGNSQTFNQRIETQSNDYLEGFEPVDEYETEEKYWVYYRIGKTEYMEAKARKKEAAIATALTRFRAGNSAEDEENFVEAIKFYLKGLQDISAYLQEDTPVELEGRIIDVGNELYSALSNITTGLDIKAEKDLYNVKRGKELNEKIVFLTTIQGRPVANLPVSLSYSGGYLKDNRAVTDPNGFFALEAGIIRSNKEKEEVIATIDLTSVARSAVEDLFIRGLIVDKNSRSATVTIVIEPVSVSFELKGPCDLFPCGKLTGSFEDVLKAEGFVHGIPEASDYAYTISFRLNPGSRAGGLTSVFIDGRMEIFDALNEPRWSREIDPVEGVGKSDAEAREKAFANLLQSLRRIWFRTGLDAIR
jgi:hypothetical protein